MVRKPDTDDSIDVIKNINEISSTSKSIEHSSNGITSYADSLKIDLKKKQQQQSINVNGLLNEFGGKLKEESNLINNQAKVLNQSTNQSVNHFAQPNNINSNKTSTTTTFSTSSLNKKKSTLISETTKSTSISKISTLSTKQFSATSTSALNDTPKTQNDSMEIDCNKKKINLIIQKDDTESIEVIFTIKGIIGDTLDVNFNEKSLKIKFKTNDNSFLRLHNINGDQLKATFTTHRIVNGTINGESPAENRFNNLKVEFDKIKLPVFIYEIKNLIDKIIPNECSYELSDNQFKIKLKKKNRIKWNGLEIIPSEMGTNFLKSVSPVQKQDNSTSKYKPLKTTSNVNKLINGYEKSFSTVNKSPTKKEQKDEIPIPPPLPPTTNNKLYSTNQKKLNGDLNDSKNDVDESSMFNNLLISPLKEEGKDVAFDNKVIPLSFNKFDDEEDSSSIQLRPQTILQQPTTSLTASLKLNLENAKSRIGYTGLNNLGNTCYMNSCLQCLSNTIELRDYFLNEDYKEDLNRDNFLGSGGKLAEAFSEVLYKLWCGESSYFSPSRFKGLIDKKCSQFVGYSQHDSVEFMEHFLDVLHEDLNKVDRNNIQPAKPIENEEELTDEQLANEQWLRHKERNDSIITKLFYGQYKSKLVCPECAKISITFDPFLYLPVPLTKNKISYDFYFFPYYNGPPNRMSCELPQGSKVFNFLELVVSKTNIELNNLVACIINQNGELEQELRNYNYLPDNLKKLSKSLHVYEKDKKSMNKFVVHQSIPDKIIENKSSSFNLQARCGFCNCQLSRAKSDLKNCPKCNKETYCSEKCRKEDYVLHSPKCSSDPVLIGWPFIFYLPENAINYEEVMNKIENSALKSVEIVESQFEEISENEQKEDKNETVHVAEEIKEGQIVSEVNDEENNHKEDEEMNICQNESTDNLLPNQLNSFTNGEIHFNKEKELQNNSQEEEVETKEELLSRATNNSYRFILTGKKNDLKAKKELIYIPKDNSDEEQDKFRKSLLSYYFLYVDWKEKYTKPLEGESGKYETFSLDITSKNLELISTGDKFNKLEFNKFEQGKSECNLEDLMTKFTEPETLSIQEAWICPKCKEPKTASKELTIWRPPQILIIQLKRFSYSSYVREKIGKFVNYPVKGLDISKFCSDSKLLDREHKPIYDLYAVIDHFGGLYGGHYTANANTSVGGKELGWRAFNDSSVRDIDEEAVVSHSAYVLFYRLRTN